MTLNESEQWAVELSLKQLSLEEHLANVRFWGKIFGERVDYLIAVAERPEKLVMNTESRAGECFPSQFWFSTDGGANFSRVPDVDRREQVIDALNARSQRLARFTGDPIKLLAEVTIPLPERKASAHGASEQSEKDDDDVQKGGESSDEVENEKFETMRVTELHRLAHVVAQITSECLTVHRGAHVLSADGLVKSAKDFHISSFYRLQELTTYQHMRVPHAPKLHRVCNSTANNSDDFFEDLSDDFPPDLAWSLRSDAYKKVVALRSNVWPGYEVRFDQTTTSPFGSQTYFGIGAPDTSLWTDCSTKHLNRL
ncbi:MAG: hypothetical protein MHM6MM_001850 [Cercozoa sp. M6MM]